MLTYQAMKVKRQHLNLLHEWADIRIRTNIQNGKVDSVWGSTQPKIHVASKKALNKSCLKLNFVRKSRRAHMSIFLQCVARRKLDICVSGLFCTKFNFEQLLFKAFFDATCIFGDVEPQTEFTSLFLPDYVVEKW